MIILQQPKLDNLEPCPYLPDREKQFQYFLAKELDAAEISFLLARGWRKFGPYYFRPACPTCQECVPIRVLADSFSPSKSQRKNLRKNSPVEVKFGPLIYNEAVYEIYRDHAQQRFGRATDLEGFLFNFYSPSCPGLQSEYYLDGELIGVGFLDRGVNCLSSVYFVFRTAYAHLGLGNFSILSEIEHCRQLGLAHYYLGYYIRDCQRMSYKNRFQPTEYYHWRQDEWKLSPP